MNLSAYVLEASAQDYTDAFENHRIFGALQAGKFSRGAYLNYLRETFHLIRHTTTVLARAASHLPDEQRKLRGWLLDQAVDEHNHDLLCKTDIEALGEDPDKFLSAQPRPGAFSLIAQTYYLASEKPIGLLGYFLTTEGIGASYAAKYADLLTSSLYGYRSDQVTFLRAHGGFDVEHFNQVKRFLDESDADDATRDMILSVRRMTITNYARMLEDSLVTDEGH